MLKILHIFLLLLFVLISQKSVHATDIFYDSFNSKEDLKWFFNKNDGEIVINDSALKLDSHGLYFPYVLNKNNNIFPTNGDFTIEIKFQFPHVDLMGEGIGIGFTNPGLGNDFFQFQVWRGTNDGFLFVYNDFNKASQGYCNDFSIASSRGSVYIPISSWSEWHVLLIKKIESRYEIFIDGTKIYTTKNNQCIPKNIWFGNKVSGGSATWTTLNIDYIRIYDNNEQIRKIVIIPGLGASWNNEAMVYNQDVDDNEWGMTPFVKNYDGLINGLENNGLVKDQDFFVWNYDWRKPVSEIVNSLNNFINLKIGESEKVDLVGHSLGGLTARIWAKDNINNPKLGKIITVGAPDKGAIDAYEVWNGGQISNNGTISSIGLNVLLQLQKMRYRSNLEAVRNFAPVVSDLLPVFDFIKKNNSIISLNRLSVKNNYLTNVNTFNFSLLPEYKAFMGIGKNTEEWINVQDRNVFDNVLGIWPDGRPIKYSYGSGDGTVLRKSTIGLNVEEINSNHGNIVNKSIENILSELGIGGTFLVSDLDDGFENSLIFFVGSPVNMKVKCDNGNEISGVDGFVMIKNEDYQNCQVNLTGIDNGKYHLVTGNTSQSDNWQYYENDISNGQVKNILVNINDGKLVSNADNINFLYELILEDTNNLKTQYLNNIFLKNITAAVENRNLNAITKNIFDFRKNTKEMKISKNIIKNIETLLVFSNSNTTKTKSWQEYVKAVQRKSLVDSVVRLKNRAGINPSLFSSENYGLMADLIKMAEKNYKEGKYADSMAKSIVALKYGMEI